MKSNKKIFRGFSLFLSVLLIFLSFDITASADSNSVTTKTTITSFNSIDTEYDIFEGTAKERAVSSFPSSLQATVKIVTDGPIQYDDDRNPKSAYNEEIRENESIPVRWSSDAYDPDVLGSYTFKPIIQAKGYECSSDIYPIITVNVIARATVNDDSLKPEKEPSTTTDTNNDTTLGTGGSQVAPSQNAVEESKVVEAPSQNATTTEAQQPKTVETATTVEDNSDVVKTEEVKTTKTGSTTSTTTKTNSSSDSSASTSTSTSTSAVQPAKETTVTVEAQSDAPVHHSASRAVSNSTQTAAVSNEATEVAEEAENQEVATEQEIPVNVTSKTETKAELTVGKGKAVINVDKGDSSDICARTKDDETLLKNILTEEQLKRVAEGATVNLKISANIVSPEDLSSKDSKNINDGVEKYKKDVPGLNIAGYVDLSIYLQIDDDDWSYVRNTNKPVELVINVPESMQGLSKNYYVLRLHDGETMMFSDDDDDPETITISTGKFSIYVIMYDSEAAAEIEKTEKSEMSILVIFLLVLLIVLMVQIVYIIAIRKKLNTVEQQ